MDVYLSKGVMGFLRAGRFPFPNLGSMGRGHARTGRFPQARGAFSLTRTPEAKQLGVIRVAEFNPLGCGAWVCVGVPR